MTGERDPDVEHDERKLERIQEEQQRERQRIEREEERKDLAEDDRSAEDEQTQG